MKIINKIDHSIAKLAESKPTLLDDSSSNEKEFNKLLSSNIDNSYTITPEAIDADPITNANTETEIPDWVDPAYTYNPQNPRKPYMRELMEAISGKGLEELYNDTDKNWRKISDQASDILYGVVQTDEDTRDWFSIMASENVLTAAREQTRVMYEPQVDIKSYFNDAGILTEQIAVIKDNKGNTLRSLSTDTTSAEETLLNFGATKKSIPTNLEERINPEKFDYDLLTFLKNFDNKPSTIQQVVLQSASEVIANKISQEIPLDELAKL